MPSQHLLSLYMGPQPGSCLFCAIKISGKGVSIPKNHIGDKDVRLWQATFCGRRHAEKFSNHICSKSHCEYAARVSRLEEFKLYVTFNPSLFGIQEGSFDCFKCGLDIGGNIDLCKPLSLMITIVQPTTNMNLNLVR